MYDSLSKIECEIMKKRGFASEEEMLAFLNKDPKSLPKFSSLRDGKRVLRGILEAVEENCTFTVYGDYDADGVMAMTILCKGLSKLCPGKINWFANDRFRDGYSITPESLGHLLERYPDTKVIISCDNGVSAVEAWEEALKRGIRVFVTDHHEQAEGREPDEAVPVVCEKSLKQKEDYDLAGREAEGFCGAELARRLILELFEMKGMEEEYRDFLDSLYAYAGLATITDVIKLNAGNHSVARAAMDIIRKDTGFWRIFNERVTSGNTVQSEIDGDTFGFYYGPAINACGRVDGRVDLPMKVFLTDEDDGALPGLIEKMAAINDERKKQTEEDVSLCEKIIREKEYEEDPFILIADERLREGINGLSAGRISNNYGVPAIVLGASEREGICKGSARSVDSVNIFEKLAECGDLLETFGGHPKAAGLSIKTENIPEFRRRMMESIAKDLVRKEMSSDDSDFNLLPSRFSASNIQKLQTALDNLQPYGEGFRKPVFFLDESADVERGVRYMSEGVHAKLRLSALSADKKEIWLMMWGKGDRVSRVVKECKNRELHIRGFVHPPEINSFNDSISFQLKPERVRLT